MTHDASPNTSLKEILKEWSWLVMVMVMGMGGGPTRDVWQARRVMGGGRTGAQNEP